jgi:hypothetical protein
MSLGGISDYLKANNISIPENYSPYQATMSQMGSYGGMDGTNYQQGMGNVYGGGSAAGGGYNSDLYKRLTAPVAQAPVVQKVTRVGGGNRSYDGAGDGGGSYSGGFPASLAPYANTLANLLGDVGLNQASTAVSRGLMSGAFSGSGAAPGSSFSPSTGAVNASSGGEYGGWGSRDAGGGFTGGSDAGVAARGGMGFGGTGSGVGGDGGSSTSSGSDSTRDSGSQTNRDTGSAKGGYITMDMLSGKNPSGPDEGYRALKSGEFVINDKAVKKYGIELMDAINSGKISKGKLRGLLEM